MGKTKNLVFKFFDTIFSGYNKQGRRPVYMDFPYVLYEYKNNDGLVSFQYSDDVEVLQFDNGSYYTVKNMFGLKDDELVDICKDYASIKFRIPTILDAHFATHNLQ